MQCGLVLCISYHVGNRVLPKWVAAEEATLRWAPSMEPMEPMLPPGLVMEVYLLLGSPACEEQTQGNNLTDQRMG